MTRSLPDLDRRTVAEQAALVKCGRVSARDLVEHSLDRIARLDGRLRAFRLVLADRARAEADARDAAAAAGERLGPLHGVPVAVKDENDIAGTVTGYGTAAFDRPATADGEVVRRLRAAGAVIVGRTAMPEFGIWPFTESATTGVTRNPWNPDRSPGGSSGGTAAAVAAGLVAAGVAGDGGGSIRIPAAWCGLVGLKPQRGRVSTAPHPDLWRSLGTLGVLTRTVADTALLLDVLAGSTPVDRFRARPWSMPLTRSLALDPAPLRIRVVLDNPALGPRPDRVTSAALRRVTVTLRALGHRVELGPLPGVPRDLTFLSLLAAGVTDEIARVEDRRRLEARTRRLARVAAPLARRAERAEHRAAEIAARVNRVFDEVDLLLTPTVPGPAMVAGTLASRGLVRTALRSLPVASWTSLWNVVGNPAVAVPIGFTDTELPLSAQVIGPPDGEPLLVQVAGQIERALSPVTSRLVPGPD